MRKIFGGWTKSKTPKPTDESVTEMLLKMNVLFKNFLTNYSWYVYFVAGFLVMCCTFYYIFDCKRQLDLRRRRQELRRASERVPQQRRPGAAYREHEIFRNAIKTVRPYIKPKDTEGVRQRPYTLRKTRSGAIYGCFSDQGTRNE